MATIQELLEAQKSPFASLLEGVARGFGGAQNTALENAKTMIALEQNRIEQEARLERNRQLQAKIAAQTEDQTQQALKSVGGRKAVMPQQKLKEKISVDEKGNYSQSFETVDTNEDSLDKIIAGRVNRGEITLEEAYGIKNKGEGMSPSLAYQIEKDKEKKDLAQKALVVPGWELTGEVQPDDTEAKDLRKGLAEFETFKTDLARYKEMIQTYGTSENTDRKIQGQMDSLAKSLQLRVKNIAQLGVLSQGDIPFIEKQIPPPGVFRTASGSLGALDEALTSAQTKMEKQMASKGYRKAGAVGTPKQTQNPTIDQPAFTPDVIAYAEKHRITPQQALQIKMSRTGAH